MMNLNKTEAEGRKAERANKGGGKTPSVIIIIIRHMSVKCWQNEEGSMQTRRGHGSLGPPGPCQDGPTLPDHSCLR